MSKTPRRRTPFYRRRSPRPDHDIRLLRRPLLPLGKRFETVSDARKYSADSEHRLDLSERLAQQLADRLNKCRTSTRPCDQTYCPICARRFRVWFIGELLRITNTAAGAALVHIETILLDQVPYDKIDLLDVKAYDAMLRKRLSRNGLNDAVVIGGIEIIYRAKPKSWVLHANLVIIGGTLHSLRLFRASFSNANFTTPVMTQPLKDRPQQLSYILKFATYHRPFAQLGSTKSTAVPLNPREHRALVSWMAKWRFQDFMFLFNARREGDKIVSGPRSTLRF